MFMRGALALVATLGLASCAGVRSAYGPLVTKVTFSERFSLFQAPTSSSFEDEASLARAVKLLDAHQFFELEERYEPAFGAPTDGGACAVEVELSDRKTRRVTIEAFAEARVCELLLDAYDAGLRRPYCHVCRAPGTFRPGRPLPP